MNDTVTISRVLATGAEGPEPCSRTQSGFSRGLSVFSELHSAVSGVISLVGRSPFWALSSTATAAVFG